jgi:hypothetical protein
MAAIQPVTTDEIRANIIGEKTAASGVTIDGLRIKDKGLDAASGEDIPLGINGTVKWRLLQTTGHIRPETDNDVNLGDSITPYRVKAVHARDFYSGGASGHYGTKTAHSTILVSEDVDRWSIDTSGNLSQDATSGGNISLTKASTYVGQPGATSLTATGTTIADALQLTAMYNEFTTVASGTGAKLHDAAGSIFIIRNAGANALKVYPPTVSGIMNGDTAGDAISIAAAAFATIVRVSATRWISIVGAASTAT